MRIDIMTLFPDAIEAMMGQSIIGRARDRGYIRLYTHQIREYTTNKQMQVDDYPYGGGRGAVMQADPLYRCWDHICQEAGQRRGMGLGRRTMIQRLCNRIRRGSPTRGRARWG